jgi:hypothetical protein
MSKRRAIWIAALVGLVLLVAASARLLLPSRTGVVVIDVSGAAGIRFHGSCAVDGSNRDLSGTAPARFTLEGHKFVYSFTPVGKGNFPHVPAFAEDRTNEFSVKVDVDGRVLSVSGGKPAQGVHGWVRIGRFSPSYWIESFDPKSPERWNLPPFGEAILDQYAEDSP